LLFEKHVVSFVDTPFQKIEKDHREIFFWRFHRDDKVALIGPNGIGKTTLLKLLVEELKPASGAVKWGATVQLGYFPQDVTEIIKSGV
jgi:ATPase subunit of ABC transporter with duplicated ATPase domains